MMCARQVKSVFSVCIILMVVFSTLSTFEVAAAPANGSTVTTVHPIADSSVNSFTATEPVAKTQSIISCELSTHTVSLGKSVTIEGGIDPYVSTSQIIYLQYSTDGGSTWNIITELVSRYEGSYDYTWEPPNVDSYLIQAYWNGNAELEAAESIPRSLNVEKIASTLTCNAEPALINIGNSTEITGYLYIFQRTTENKKITISYRPSGGSWSDILTVSTDHYGWYSYYWTPTAIGTYEVKASWSGDETSTEAENVATVTVTETATEEPNEVTPEEPSQVTSNDTSPTPTQPPQQPEEPNGVTSKELSEITCALSSTQIKKAETVTVTGSLSPAYTGSTITLTFTKPDGSTFTRQVTTMSDGKFSTTYIPDASGTWSIFANWAGDEEYEGDTSPSVSFTVNEQGQASPIDYLTRPDVIGVTIAVISSICGGVAWLAARMRKRELRKLLEELIKIYSKFKMNSRRCEVELYRLRDVALEKLKAGKINESSYAVIKERIDEYLHEIRSRIIDERLGGFPSKLRDELHAMIKKGEISKKEYETLEKLIDRTTELKESDKLQLRKVLEKWKKDYLKKQ